MPQGYYTIDNGKTPMDSSDVTHFGLSLTVAVQVLERQGKPGIYRLVKTQRIIWCEKEGSTLNPVPRQQGNPE